MEKSFSLIELIIVVSIIAVLSTLGLSTYNGFQRNARDTRRKTDLKTITAALNAYYAVNGRYPVPNASGAGGDANSGTNIDCGYDQDCYVTSNFSGKNWIGRLTAQDYIEANPVDPINAITVGSTPHPFDDVGNFVYAYGRVYNNGQTYDLTARLENGSDPDRCWSKKYLHYDPASGTHVSWCLVSGDAGNNLYEMSPNTF